MDIYGRSETPSYLDERDPFSYFVGTVPGISREHVAKITSVVTVAMHKQESGCRPP